MPHHVAQRLLQDPVGGERHARREAVEVAVQARLHPQARRPRVGDQLVQPVQARLRGGLGAVLRAQDAQDPPHLGQRVQRRRPDLGEVAARLVRKRLDLVGRRLRLDRDHRHVVGDDVVHLPRDPLPLHQHRFGVLVPPLLLGELPAGRPPDPDGVADRQRHQQQHRRPGRRLRVLDPDTGEGQGRDAQRDVPRAAHRHRVDAHERGERPALGVLDVGRPRAQRQNRQPREAHPPGRQRMPVPQRQRRRHEDGEQQGGAVARVVRRLGAHGLPQHGARPGDDQDREDDPEQVRHQPERQAPDAEEPRPPQPRGPGPVERRRGLGAARHGRGRDPLPQHGAQRVRLALGLVPGHGDQARERTAAAG